MRRIHAFYSHWCALFDFHLRRKRLSASAFALKVGASQQSVHGYLVGRARPPLDDMVAWATALGLTGSERDQFIDAASEAHTPDRVWRRLVEAEQRLTETVPMTRTEAECAYLNALAIIASLVDILRDTEALFYLRTIPMNQISKMREALGASIRHAIERYGKPPKPWPMKTNNGGVSGE